MNKCAKFHKDSPSGKKVKFNLARAIELSDGRFCVQLCIETLCKRATSVAHLTNFSFEFFLWNFHRRCLSTCSIPWCKKVKNDQKLKSRGGGGSCLNFIRFNNKRITLKCGYQGEWFDADDHAQSNACSSSIHTLKYSATSIGLTIRSHFSIVRILTST